MKTNAQTIVAAALAVLPFAFAITPECVLLSVILESIYQRFAQADAGRATA